MLTGVVVPGPLHSARQVAHPARQHHRAAQRHGLNRDIVHEETYNHQGMLVGFNTFYFLSFDFDIISTDSDWFLPNCVFYTTILWPLGLGIVYLLQTDIL